MAMSDLGMDPRLFGADVPEQVQPVERQPAIRQEVQEQADTPVEQRSEQPETAKEAYLASVESGRQRIAGWKNRFQAFRAKVSGTVRKVPDKVIEVGAAMLGSDLRQFAGRKVNEGITAAGDGLNQFKDGFVSSAKEGIHSDVETVKTVARDVRDGVVGFKDARVGELHGTVATAKTTARNVRNDVVGFKDARVGELHGTVETAKTTARNVRNDVVGFKNARVGELHGTVTTAKTTARNVRDGVVSFKDTRLDELQGTVETAKTTARNVRDGVVDFKDARIGELQGTVESIKKTAADAPENVKEFVEKAVDQANVLLNQLDVSILEAQKQFNESAKATGNSMRTGVENTINGAKASVASRARKVWDGILASTIDKVATDKLAERVAELVNASNQRKANLQKSSTQLSE